jgi:hypothetical protein
MPQPDGSRSSDDGALSQESHAAKNSSPDLLRYVLEATLAKGQNVMSPEEWQAVRQVAIAQQYQELPIDQVAEQLVEALLTTRFQGLQGEDTHRRMCQTIASSLCGDPDSMNRLKIFWKQLRESIT